jgi:phosphatidylinositol 4-kinase
MSSAHVQQSADCQQPCVVNASNWQSSEPSSPEQRALSAQPGTNDGQQTSQQQQQATSSSPAAAAGDDHLTPEQKRQKDARAIFGETFEAKCERIRRRSPHGRRPGWAVRPVIVKSGDDCRQELLAVQLIRAFHDIFQEAHLDLWLRPYEVLVTSNRTALIELIPDSLSIHTIKAKSPPGTSLVDHFNAMYIEGSPECYQAKRKFAESMAAYSLVCYLLQIKDRHNGNLMLDTEGHIIHIDYGFMLSNSPGGVNFEGAPFKLTRELLEVMDSNSEGKPSELFDYYKVLCIQGFLACRKHADRIILLVDMMSNSGCPAFKTGPRAVKSLRTRFHLSLTEDQCMQMVLNLISDSLDSWRTRQYDYYQRVLNGIL